MSIAPRAARLAIAFRSKPRLTATQSSSATEQTQFAENAVKYRRRYPSWMAHRHDHVGAEGRIRMAGQQPLRLRYRRARDVGPDAAAQHNGIESRQRQLGLGIGGDGLPRDQAGVQDRYRRARRRDRSGRSRGPGERAADQAPRSDQPRRRQEWRCLGCGRR